jgi:hypothetical protein
VNSGCTGRSGCSESSNRGFEEFGVEYLTPHLMLSEITSREFDSYMWRRVTHTGCNLGFFEATNEASCIQVEFDIEILNATTFQTTI